MTMWLKCREVNGEVPFQMCKESLDVIIGLYLILTSSAMSDRKVVKPGNYTYTHTLADNSDTSVKNEFSVFRIELGHRFEPFPSK